VPWLGRLPGVLLALVLAFTHSDGALAAQTFERGDSNGDACFDLTDAVHTLRSLFLGMPAALYRVGRHPDVVLDDLDGDGDVDLAVANSTAGAVTVLHNQGDGAFEAHPEYDVGRDCPVSVALGDIDQDRDGDLAVASTGCMDFESGLSVLRNKGSAALELEVIDRDGAPSSVVLEDLDGDGGVDMAVANRHTVSTLRNRGDGTYEAKIEHPVGDSPVSVAARDLDGDGDADLAVANSGLPAPSLAVTVSVLRNRGGGTFEAQTPYVAGADPHSVVLGDCGTHAPGSRTRCNAPRARRARRSSFQEEVDSSPHKTSRTSASTITSSGRIKGRATSSSSLRQTRTPFVTARSSAVSGSVGCSATTIDVLDEF
jgi:hypothetical protein